MAGRRLSSTSGLGCMAFRNPIFAELGLFCFLLLPKPWLKILNVVKCFSQVLSAFPDHKCKPEVVKMKVKVVEMLFLPNFGTFRPAFADTMHQSFARWV